MDLLNITNINYEEEIRKTIDDINREYDGLEKEQTCFIYSSLIYESLRKKHIMSRIISTSDLGLSYEHRFVLVREKEYYYVVDMTFNQFLIEVPEEFSKLVSDGYQKIDRDMLKNYLGYISREPINRSIDSLFFK